MTDRILGFDNEFLFQSVMLFLNIGLFIGLPIAIVVLIIWVMRKWKKKNKRIDQLEQQIKGIRKQVKELQKNR